MRIRSSLCVLFLFIFYAGCATRIPFTVTKPAEVDMSSTRTIALLNFSYVPEHTSISPEDLLDTALEKIFGVSLGGAYTIQEEVEKYITERFILTLVHTNYFHVLSTQQIRDEMGDARRTGADAVQIGKKVGAQAIIYGEIYLMQSWDEENIEMESREDPVTHQKVDVPVTWVNRKTELGLNYYVVNTENGTLIATRTLESSSQAKEEKKNLHRLPSARDMYREIADSFMSEVARHLAPYKVQQTRRLMKDRKSSQMKAADRYVKGGVYDRALELYLDEWRRKRNASAGHNAAILYEVTGDLDAAISLMKQVVDAHPEKKIMKEYSRLLNARKEQERLLKQLG
jgi:hypothetical protein